MRTSSTLRALTALLLALSLVAAACGSSDDEETAADIVADVLEDDDATTSDDDGDDSESDTSDEADDTEEPPADEPDEADEPEEDDEPVAPSGDAAVFCARYAENEALFDELDFFDPDAVETWVNTSRGLLAEAIGDAPGELVGDLQTIQTNFDEFAAALEAFGYDVFAAGEELDEVSESPEADAASERIDAWIAANCPDAASDDSTDDALDFTTPEALEGILESEAGRELFIDGMTDGTGLTRDQAECMIDNLDADMLSILATNPDAIGTDGALDLLDVLSACGIDIGALTG